MAESTKKRVKAVASMKKAKKTRKTKKDQTKLAKNVDCLLELHKLQGVLLAQLRKEIQ